MGMSSWRDFAKVEASELEDDGGADFGGCERINEDSILAEVEEDARGR